jgi:hypothetical protein
MIMKQNAIFSQFVFLVGKGGLTSAFTAAYIFSSELFPTTVRTAAVGICSTCGRIGAIITPWISIMVRTQSYDCVLQRQRVKIYHATNM